MTTNAELIDQWMSRLGQRTSTRVRADLVAEVNSAIRNLESEAFMPWFLQSTLTLNVAIDESFRLLPTDFVIEREGTRPYYVLEGTVYYLRKMISGAIFGHVTENTRPTRYSIIGNEFHFRPVADQAYAINIPYYAKTGGGIAYDQAEVDNLWLLNAEDWVAYKALKTTAGFHLQNTQKAADFAQMEHSEKLSIYKLHQAREAQNQDYEVGGISDGS